MNKPISPSDISEGIKTLSDSLSNRVGRKVYRAIRDDVDRLARYIREEEFENARRTARALEFTKAMDDAEGDILAFTRQSALLGAGAVDRPSTSLWAQGAPFPVQIDIIQPRLIKRIALRLIDKQTQRSVESRIARAIRFQKVRKAAGDPIDPSDLARQINRFLRGEIKRVVDVSANITGTRVSAYGMLHEARARGISRYRIDAVLDDRTTDICRNMNGREFSVEDAFSRTQMVLNIDDPQAVAEFAPFPDINQLKGETNQRLQQNGFDVPPFHFLCRSVVVLVGQDVEYEPVPVSKFPDQGQVWDTNEITQWEEASVPRLLSAVGAKDHAELLALKEWADTIVDHPGTHGKRGKAYAINAYTGNAFYGINTTLRQKSRWESDDHREIARSLDRALDNAPKLEEDLIVYRGTAGTVLDQLDDIGKVVQDDGFMSTSGNLGTARQWGRKDAVLQILVPKGQKALPLGEMSLTSAEAETLLPRGMQLRVVGIDEIDVPGEGKQRVIRVVAQGDGKKVDLDDLPDFEEWIEAQDSIIKDEHAPAREKYVYGPGDIYIVRG